MSQFYNDVPEHNPLLLFEQQVRQIHHFTCQHGVTHALLAANGKPSWESFLRACHHGFSEGQKLIIVELNNVQNTKKRLKKSLKLARKIRDKVQEKRLKTDISIENFKEFVLRKLADSIAWHMIGGQNYIARRLCLREANRPNLETANLSSVIKLVNLYNDNEILTFALISDITSFIQIGDVLRLSPDGLQIIEVKEGVKNLQAASILQELKHESNPEQQLEKLIPDDSLRQQAQRMLRQNRRSKQVTSLLNTGVGKDPATGDQVTITDVEHPEEKYDHVLSQLISQLSPEKDWAYTVVDNCLHIGVYKGKWRAFGANVLRESALTNLDKKYPVTNLREGLGQALVEPLFLKQLTEDQIFDIVFGRIFILLLLRVDHLLLLFDEKQVTAQLLSLKRSRKERAKFSPHELLLHQGQCVEVESKSGTKILGDGIATRILYDSMTPHSVVEMIANDPTL